jgi:2'-5' RNA ligase
MPWDVFSENGKHCVYKVGDDDQPIGDSLGCHDSPEEAMEQVSALHANEAAKAVKAHTGAIVALMIPPEVAGKLALPGGEPPEEMHITLAYLGETGGISSKAARAMVQEWAARTPPVTGMVNGVGKFNHDDDGQAAFYVSFDAPSLPRLHDSLMSHIEYQYPPMQAGPMLHGFTPHITLAYIAPDAPLPLESIEAIPITFERASLLYAFERFDFDLLGEPYMFNGAMVKAIKNDGGEWLLDVLGAPYGGPVDGKDGDGDYFDASTDFWLEEIGKRPIVHYHGWDTKGRPTDPEIIGEELGYEQREDGIWFRVLLNKASKTAGDIWEAAQKGLARASSGAIQHLIRPLKKAADGHIDLWPIAELSLMDTRKGNMPVNSYAVALPVMKATYKAAHLNLKILTDSAVDADALARSGQPSGAGAAEAGQTNQPNKETEMPDITLDAIEAYLQKREAKKADEARIAQLEKDAEELKTLKAQISEAQATQDGRQQIKRLPNPAPEGESPAPVSVSSRWDGFSVGQLGLAYEMLKATGTLPSSELYRAMHAKALKAVEAPDYAANQIVRDARGNILREYAPDESQKVARAVKALNPMQLADRPAMKSNELMRSDYSSYGDQWVPAMWSPELWDLVRNGAPVLRRFRQVEVPGESLTIPTLAGRTTVYKIAQTVNQSELTLAAAAAQMSKATTSNVVLTPVKGMAWVSWTGELGEDSIIPMLPSLQMALKQDLEEQIDEILISGDTETGATNISDYANGAVATTWHLLMANGLRDYALANSNASDRGAVTAEDFTAVMALLGAAGAFALDPDKLFWVLDPGVYRKALTLGEVLTAEKNSRGVGTFESGRLVKVFGSDVVVSDKYGLTDVSGHIHNTANNNTKGSFLLVRPDRWVVGFGRKIVIESPARDLTQIVTDTQHLIASFRLDFKNNGEGSSCGYNVTV